MVERAHVNVSKAGLDERVAVEHGDICNLRFSDGSFDRVVPEAVTHYVRGSLGGPGGGAPDLHMATNLMRSGLIALLAPC
jgi:hypothetical protein